jgi:hypothetical protein
MTRGIFQFETDGGPALGFDTGFDSRAFAQAQFARTLTEPGLRVFPGGGSEPWLASGVVEVPARDGAGTPSMVVWGPPVAGERLDLLINDNARRDEALAAIGCWIQAVPVLEAARQGKSAEPPRPFAALADSAGAVFFAPDDLARRCMQAGGDTVCMEGGERYVHPDRDGAAAAAFTAAAMLYRVFAGTPAFTAADEETLHEDMREGNFLPLYLAAPGLDGKWAALIDRSLAPAKSGEGRGLRGGDTGEALPGQFLALLKTAGSADTFFRPLSDAERETVAKETALFLKKKKFAVQSRRFVMRNRSVITGCAAALLAVAVIAYSIVQSRSALPTTAGMDSAQVVESYYGAFGALDHQLMEACVTNGAGKNDINMVAGFFVITRTRQAYEGGGAPQVIPAEQWIAGGMPPVDSPVFGVSDLVITRLSGEEDSDAVRYRADYVFWMPWQGEGGGEADGAEAAARPPQRHDYGDELTLIRKKGAWRIASIQRAVEEAD